MASNPMGTCPLGGLWYTCIAQSPTFFGCCTSDPCNGVGCPASDLRAAGMGTASGPDAGVTNDGSYYPNVQCSTGQWWTCALQTPSFQGCCESNPCGGSGSAGGCPAGQLFAAAFKSIPAVPSAAASTAGASTQAPSKSTGQTTTTASPTSQSSSTAGTTTSTTSQNPTTTGTTTLLTQQLIATSTNAAGSPTTATVFVVQSLAPVSNPASSSSSPNIAAIAGGAAGGAVVFLILAFIFWRCCRKRNKDQVQDSTPIAEVYEPMRNQAEMNEPVARSAVIKPYPSPNPSSAPTSPGPPPYRYAAYPSPHAELQEIDSTPVHEVYSPQTLNTYVPQPESVAELPVTQHQGNNIGLGLGHGRATSGGSASELGPGGGDARSTSGASYTGWETYAR